eukprot:GDKI01015771.1.p1 GENE.GDKI01015771.1~~GDKI01015771.1.p1  ORF type:complete len:127 (-),score=11.54 GDKI01015771.1:59-439(-)
MASILREFVKVVERDLSKPTVQKLWHEWGVRIAASKTPHLAHDFVAYRNAVKAYGDFLDRYEIATPKDEMDRIQKVAKKVGLTFERNTPFGSELQENVVENERENGQAIVGRREGRTGGWEMLYTS